MIEQRKQHYDKGRLQDQQKKINYYATKTWKNNLLNEKRRQRQNWNAQVQKVHRKGLHGQTKIQPTNMWRGNIRINKWKREVHIIISLGGPLINIFSMFMMYNEEWTMTSKHDTFNKRKIYGIALRKFIMEKITEWPFWWK